MEITQKVDNIIDNYGGDSKSILAILQDVQAEYNYLPREAVNHIVEKMEVSLARVSALATFFSSFSLTPRGEHIITICMGTACYVRGAPQILKEVERDLEIKDGETTPDQKFSIETVNCVGACALGPLVIVDGNYHGNISTTDVKKVVETYK
ncbi:MAG: NAD(P)H-dependent oxidoreductase subunit E [Deltaproteobacteria bacterium]|jgi:NADH-quinone oxidoreductase subunit E|nr:NAD(P)H-dependent oxidoreductase subunit E [Deltaproteobacteria bacterium]